MAGTPVQPTRRATANPVAVGDVNALGQTLKPQVDPPYGSNAGQPVYDSSQNLNQSQVAGVTVTHALNTLDNGLNDLANIVQPVPAIVAGAIYIASPILTDGIHGAELLFAQHYNARLINDALALAASKGNVYVQMAALPYDIGTNTLVLPPTQGVRFGGLGSSSFDPAVSFTQGSQIIYSGGGDKSWDVQITGTSTANVLIGTGQKTFPCDAALLWRPGDPVTFTATAGTIGSVSGTVFNYNPLGNTVVIDVTSTTGAGTGSEWSFTTEYDQPPFTARSQSGLVIQNYTLQTTNSSFRGYMHDLNGLSLSADTSRSFFDHVTCFTNVSDETDFRSWHVCGAVYMTAGFGLRTEFCKFDGLLRGVLTRGNWNEYHSTNESRLILDVACDMGGDAVFAYVEAEPSIHVPSSTYGHGGIRVTNSTEVDSAYYVGDICEAGPVITHYGCNGQKIGGNFSIVNTAIGADRFPVALDGCLDVEYCATDQLCAGAISVLNALQASVGIYATRTAQTTTTFFDDNSYKFTRISARSQTSIFGLSGVNQISGAQLTNGAEATSGITAGGVFEPGPFENNIYLGGFRAIAFPRGVQGAEVSLFGDSKHITLFCPATANDTGLEVLTYNPDGPSNTFAQSILLNRFGVFSLGPLTTVTRDVSGTGSASAKSINWNLAPVQNIGKLAANLTITMTAPGNPTTGYTLVIRGQQGAGPFTITLNPAAETINGAGIVLPALNNQNFDIILCWTGSGYRAEVKGPWS